MTDHDADGLAPVTDLFGARSSRRAAQAPKSGSAENDVDPEWSAPVIRKPATHAVGTRATDAPSEAPVVALAPVAQHDASADALIEQPTERSDDGQRAEAERLSMRALGRRGVSEAELRKTLASHELDPEVIERELARLRGVGLVDDAALAADLIDRLRERKGLGQRGIVAELRRRQIDQGTIDAVMEEDDDPSEEVARAVEVAERRARQLRSLDRETAERRLTGFLLRRGYGSGAVRAAVDRALGGGRAPASRTPGRVHFE